MLMACAVAFTASLHAAAAAGQDAPRVSGAFTGRYHCSGQWTGVRLTFGQRTGVFGITESDGSLVGSITIFFYRSATNLDATGYSLAGRYDAKTGRFRLDPDKWTSAHPDAFELIGVEGTFDPSTGRIAARMTSDKCDALELVPGQALPPLATANERSRKPDVTRPEQRARASNVTDYLDVASRSPDFEYLMTSWFDIPGTVREQSAIDETNDALKKQNFICVGSQRVAWDGAKGVAADSAGVLNRYVVECVGECGGVSYRPNVGAIVTHFGLSQPLPMLEIKGINVGATRFRWTFGRTSGAGAAPDVWVHRWAPATGMGPFDPTPEELARRIASAPPCRAQPRR